MLSVIASASSMSPRRFSPRRRRRQPGRYWRATPKSARARSTPLSYTRHPIEAVYRSEVEKLAAAEQLFAASMPPLEALRAWMHLFIDHVSAKTLIIPP